MENVSAFHALELPCPQQNFKYDAVEPTNLSNFAIVNRRVLTLPCLPPPFGGATTSLPGLRREAWNGKTEGRR